MLLECYCYKFYSVLLRSVVSKRIQKSYILSATFKILTGPAKLFFEHVQFDRKKKSGQILNSDPRISRETSFKSHDY